MSRQTIGGMALYTNFQLLTSVVSIYIYKMVVRLRCVGFC